MQDPPALNAKSCLVAFLNHTGTSSRFVKTVDNEPPDTLRFLVFIADVE